MFTSETACEEQEDCSVFCVGGRALAPPRAEYGRHLLTLEVGRAPERVQKVHTEEVTSYGIDADPKG